MDEWTERLQSGAPHKCAAIFVDNSGVDVVLGILPFARDLLQRGTKVSVLVIILGILHFRLVSFGDFSFSISSSSRINK